MVQVDVFWAYGIGAGFATAAAHRLRAAPRRGGETAARASDPQLTATVLYCGMLFAPSGAWLLWGFPDWETMQVAADRSAIPAWLVALFAATNVSQGLLGYWVASRLIAAGRVYAAFLQVLLGYLGMFFILVHGWDGRGYQRFFSEGREQFAAWPEQPGPGDALSRVGDWLTSPVALTLAGMGVVLIPAMFALIVPVISSGRREAGVPQRGAAGIVGAWLLAVFGVALGTAVASSVLIHLLGWWVGVPVAAVSAAVLVARRRTGLAHRVFGLLGLPDTPARTAAAGAPSTA
ncbi:hypothetical protein [Streptomyces sp. HUAS ZL42]|uniref:hypothetical protein n=1 Tax=Streptomyces sp. HUAS ZL42 TaxID=3231715 RepID=UPI00345EB9CE